MKKLPIGVVGLNWGRSVIENQILTGPAAELFELVAVCAREPATVEACARDFRVKAYHRLGDLLGDSRIAAIGLMTGPVGRAGLIRQSVEAGKHVMTTKPLEVDPDAALAVLREARALGRIVHANSPTPVPSDDIRRILDWQREFRLGRPIAARADIWSNYREVADGSWYDDPLQCPVAPIFRLGIYLINDLIRLLGTPTEVSVMSSRLFTGRPTPDNAQLSLRFANGAVANVFSSFCINDAQWWLSSLTLNFENGTVYRNVGPATGANPRCFPELKVVVNRDGVPEVHSAVATGSTEDYQWSAFHRAIHGQPIDADLSEDQIVAALRVFRAMARAESSQRIELV